MQLLAAPDKYSCLLASVAMCLDWSVEATKKLVSNTDPGVATGFGPRGYIMDDFNRPLGAFGYGFIPLVIEATTEDGYKFFNLTIKEFLDQYAKDVVGLFQGTLKSAASTNFDAILKNKGIGHGVAWNGTRFFDPRGFCFSIDDITSFTFELHVFWKMVKYDV